MCFTLLLGRVSTALAEWPVDAVFAVVKRASRASEHGRVLVVRSERQRGLSSDARSADESGRDALPALGEQEVRRKLGVLGGGLGERLLECALAAGLAGNRQLRGPNGDAADERCGALAACDLDWCALT